MAYVGLESLSGTSVQHIRASRLAYDQSGNPVAMIAGWSQIDAYLDAQSLLPVDIRFNVYPDDDTNVRIPVEITYSDYRVVNGAHIPFHIQKYLQNILNFDLTITGATFNSGITLRNFQVPVICGAATERIQAYVFSLFVTALVLLQPANFR